MMCLCVVQEYRRDIRKKVAEVFQMVDEDGSGVLDKGEVGLLQKKINKKFRKVESSRGRWRHLLAPSLLSHGMCLSNWSVSRLTVSTHDGQIAFDPPFDLDRDFAEMDEDGEGTVTFDEFENWFKVRCSRLGAPATAAIPMACMLSRTFADADRRRRPGRPRAAGVHGDEGRPAHLDVGE